MTNHKFNFDKFSCSLVYFVFEKLYSKISNRHSHVIKLSDKEKRIIVFEINTGKTSIDEVINHYKVSSASVKAWVKLYTCDIELEMPKVEKTEEEKVTDKNSQKLIDELKLKVLGLETMIDIAEEKFKIDIRKKSGTKQ